MSGSAQPRSLNAVHAADPTARLPVASYIPSGIPDIPLPVGKYYPSNYEMRKKNGASKERGAKCSGLQAQVPELKIDSTSPCSSPPPSGSPSHRLSHRPSNSDAQRRLLQYRRDMMAQATLAANRVMGGGGADQGLSP